MAEEDFHKQNTEPGVPPDKTLPSKDIPVPETIGPYKIECLLQKGGMSLLYLGSHHSSNEPIAIKVLSQKYLSNPDVVQRFLNEAEIISMTDHPNIVKLYGHGEWEGGLYIAMEFIQGISLRQYILQNPISLNQALKIVIDISYALCHLHTHGVIHRDLKPENILVTEQGGIKVIDFGISQLLTEKESPEARPKQRLIGTPIYMSPEQRENPEMVSFPSDVYSLGIIAYELVLGKLSHGKIHLSLMPRGIQKILYKALQPDASDRYQDIVDFISEVSGYTHSAALEKEKGASNFHGELSENLRLVQKNLVPESPPLWKGMEIGLANYQGIALAGVYYDFFEIPGNSYGIIISESSAKGAKGIAYTAVFRGMVRALCQLTTKPVELVSILNDLLIQDRMEPAFTLSYLIVNPEESQYSFISCGYGSLWHIVPNEPEPRCIVTDNLALGIDAEAQFYEEIGDWNQGETLLLNTFAALKDEQESTDKNTFILNEELFHKTLTENREASAQDLVNNILRKIRTFSNRKLQDRPITLISTKKT